MSLSNDQVGHIARLARIAVSASELEATRDKLNGIFGLIEQMQAVDTSGVEPMSHPQELATRLRPDLVTEADRREAFQKVAPQTEAGLYLVPKVIE
ncbi:MAG TPA: Asp-tRNA(Asn)/Glu-tRNA(Gln) amidotransferase subunit GatC [Thauera sp.]|jgi:aspartyl-tRNA(Asn)/glutamyl-tRNA(Gln) amidotransferase subunit C|uniref:Asp-tRNA(Asn)/Glu-tRNA(Gln) amidotransferase subunit GatC n=1 Tax=Thauera sp. TaxID=1905334 RepID=UPI000FC0EB0F|nr:Asp-tRNA(Asn)/Glu-tRNA(Gln) amidotransferase subunit GatC [Thauera sp.]RTL21521.1 MAG: Asp-tRNA(Asn)/Glu-tRNA(Gln) amidotransferase subunit GatC [Rhodocyclaceae bacterium]MCB1944343.1 Asp-tRNA(Asn)/Glu-tRNA(Gln) amidotransferase subunit GatC [Thauera sp.]MCP5225867.1 Asp-tRNA(Asn)/Glu-tRNA(Gln) amidotransferase subunit GatC [Thauera sp.]HPE03393.1 Asp-tRNA(Asn)/Glu-tRNA(Gln) amidotransferase subunit GatC [Thauera sp.]HRV76627.1 Asp-tRNA(Asn)/Glu-tRNA(Gln) amidotransferase subunit GatC [Thau